MQNRIEEHTEYERKIKNNPIELLLAIRKLMYEPTRAKYCFASLTNGLFRLLTCKQQDNEGTLDYIKRFKQERDITKAQLGKHVLNGFVETWPEYVVAESNGDSAM